MEPLPEWDCEKMLISLDFALVKKVDLIEAVGCYQTNGQHFRLNQIELTSCRACCSHCSTGNYRITEIHRKGSRRQKTDVLVSASGRSKVRLVLIVNFDWRI